MNLPTPPRSVLALAAVALALGLPACNKTEPPKGKTTPGPGKVRDKESPRKDGTARGPAAKDKESAGKDKVVTDPSAVTPEEITRAFRADPKAAQKKYGGRAIEVEGEVLSGDRPHLSADWVLTLPGAKVPGDHPEGKVVDCIFEPGSPSFDKARDVKAGQKVKVRGKVGGALPHGVRLVGCELLEVK